MLVIGFPFAYWLAMRPHRHKTLLLLLVVVPFWTSILIRTYAWALILSGDGRFLGAAVAASDRRATRPAQHLEGRGIGLVYDYLPLMLSPCTSRSIGWTGA
jgi:spermidine/putrescine transport system permease protein